ncbi:phenazine biosynthesis-like domain-containing protein 1 [Gigantopelta aegis]|uniref:phenazine biosynthesis-like domain-containing protein 1 n=1 Tax=Gigantopelta aegis TaxID=1735272 RepID=UPI001B88DEDB|nr:phenazine biosynthesis-like domain-containing protein 1 [Gigantopelta aegis]
MSQNTTFPIYTVDAFTDVKFRGNPAAVCPLSDDKFPDDLLQKISAEINLAETAFITRLKEDDSFENIECVFCHVVGDTFRLRWFTPVCEIKLCGHGTLATSAVLFDKLGNKSDKLVFKTLSGDLVVKRNDDCYLMDFPLGRTVEQNIERHEGIIKSLGETPELVDVVYCESLRYLLIRVKEGWTRDQFEDWTPNISIMNDATDSLVALIITTRGSPQQGYKDNKGKPYDFVSRVFDPWTGLSEDPVTGSAQTVLVDYWSNVCGKNEFFTRQCSKRGGEIYIRLKGDRVELLGKAVFMMEGRFHL